MGYVCTKPQATFYMMVKTLEEDTAFCARAADMGLILVPCSGFGFPGYVRVALCVPEDTARRSAAALEKLMESDRKKEHCRALAEPQGSAFSCGHPRYMV
jgi:aspartate aminotransferase